MSKITDIDSYNRLPHPLISFDRSCKDCTLGNSNTTDKTKCVGGAGPNDLSLVKLIIISDHPGFYEQQRGMPFVNNQIKYKGDSSEKFNEWLNAGALLRMTLSNMFNLNTYNDCYMTNVIKCEPGKNLISNVHIKTCVKYLKQELNILDYHCPTAPILIAGNKAFKSFKQICSDLQSSKFGLQDCRRRTGLVYNQHPLVFTVNPASCCKTTFRIETDIYKYDDLIYIPTKKDYPILVGSPIWMWLRDLELLSEHIK